MNAPLVFLPGMMCDARLFTPQIEAFSAERPVMVFPLHGTDTMAGLAQAVLEAAPPKFALAGLSMGGIVAMEIMRQAPERVSRLALLDTNALADPPENAIIRQAQVVKAKRGQLASVIQEEMKPNYLADGPDRARILKLCMDMALGLGPQVFANQSNAIQNRPDQRETLRIMDIPTLILCGKEDRLCPIERHELMHDLVPNSHLEIIPEAGHLPTLEQPQQTNKALVTWLKQ